MRQWPGGARGRLAAKVISTQLETQTTIVPSRPNRNVSTEVGQAQGPQFGTMGSVTRGSLAGL
jgi:hypothetical protein